MDGVIIKEHGGRRGRRWWDLIERRRRREEWYNGLTRLEREDEAEEDRTPH